MDLKKAAISKQVSDKWGFAIFTTDYEDKPCKPVLYLLEKWTRDDGSSWWQLCGGWYMSTLMEDHRPYSGISIDFGQGWVCPGQEYEPIYQLAVSWVKLNELTDVLEREIA